MSALRRASLGLLSALFVGSLWYCFSRGPKWSARETASPNLYFDYVLYKRELEAAGIPHLLLEFEEKTFTFERLRTEVETFVESLLFD